MEIKTDKETLIKAFKAYNKRALEEPEDFEVFDETEECAKLQAEELIHHINEVNKSK